MAQLLRHRGLPLDACALVALHHVGADTDAAVEATIRAKILPRWSQLDALAKEVIVLHALSTNATIWDKFLGGGGRAESFRVPLALLCEEHLLEQITDEAFSLSATSAYERLVAGAKR